MPRPLTSQPFDPPRPTGLVVPTQQRSQGFTLLELMLSMVLMVALLSATWMLLGVFRDRVEKAQTQTERRHLTRSLQLTLASDLRNRFLIRPDEELSSSPSHRHEDQDEAAAQNDGSTPSGAGSARSTVAADRDSNRSSNATPRTEPRSALGSRFRQPAMDASVLADESATPDAADTDSAINSLDADVERLNSDPVADGEWKTAERFFLGTSQSVRFDVIPPAMPGRSAKPNEPPNLEDAAIPDVIHRVVYVFSDPAMALVSDRPPGLLRGEFTTHQLLDFANAGADTANLFSFLRPTLMKIAPDAFLSLDGTSETLGPLTSPASRPLTDSTLPPQRTPTDDTSTENRHPNEDALTEPPPEDPQGLLQHVDYAPEVATFLLRYYDGESWTASWDSRQHAGQWPVAVELRFQLSHEIARVADDNEDDGSSISDNSASPSRTTDPSALGPAALNGRGTNPLEPQDDELLSAQTQPINDHRYLVFLRSSEGQPHSSAEDSTGESADNATDERHSSDDSSDGFGNLPDGNSRSNADSSSNTDTNPRTPLPRGTRFGGTR